MAAGTDGGSTTSSPDGDLRTSWEANAAAWTDAVRGGRIPSRRAGTDAAVLTACARALEGATGEGGRARRVLDVGCGEGWLARALAAGGADVLGVDGSAALIDAARAATTTDGGAGVARFEVASYDDLVARADRAAGPFALIVCNFALLGDPLAPLLAALGRRLAEGGRLVVQTAHPWAAAGDGRYESGWRVETFASFEQPFPSPMPWFFRTLGSWVGELGTAGLRLLTLGEPTYPETGRPLSLLLECGRLPA